MQKTIRIAVCDDERIIMEIVKEEIQKVLNDMDVKEYIIDLYSNGLDLLKSSEKYYLLILDIEMPGVDGLTLAKIVNESKDKPIIIFLTSHKELMTCGFHVRAFRYLIKPIIQEEFAEAISSAMKEILLFDTLVLEENKKQQVIDISDIIYIESLGEGCCIHTEKLKFIRKESLKYWTKRLPEKVLIQTHRGYIVNLGYVRSLTSNTILLKTEEKIPLAARKRKYVNDALHEYVRRKARR